MPNLAIQYVARHDFNLHVDGVSDSHQTEGPLRLHFITKLPL